MLKGEDYKVSQININGSALSNRSLQLRLQSCRLWPRISSLVCSLLTILHLPADHKHRQHLFFPFICLIAIVITKIITLESSESSKAR